MMTFLFGQHSKKPFNINFFYDPHAQLKLFKKLKGWMFLTS